MNQQENREIRISPDALIALVVAEAEDRELSAMPSLEEMNAAFHPSEEFQKKMDRLLKQAKRKQERKGAWRATKRLFVVATTVVTAFACILMPVQAVQEAVVSTVLNWRDQFVEILYSKEDDPNAVILLQNVELTYLPEGFTETPSNRTSNTSFWNEYQSENGEWLTVRILPIQDKQSTFVDDEYTHYYQISFDGIDAVWGSTMGAKGDFLHGKLDEVESLLRLENYFRDSAYGNSVIQQNYREENAELFDQYEQIYRNKSYTLYTDSLTIEYRLFTQLVNEYDTVAGYTDFLDSVQTKANQLSGISIFQNDETGYDLKSIEVTAAVYAGLDETAIDYYPQKGLYTAISYTFTDLILLASILVLALLLVRQERDSGLLSLVRSLPAGRLHTALAKLGSFALSLLAVLVLLYGVNLAYCAATFGLGPLSRTIQSVPALMRCTMQITVGECIPSKG